MIVEGPMSMGLLKERHWRSKFVIAGTYGNSERRPSLHGPSAGC